MANCIENQRKIIPAPFFDCLAYAGGLLRGTALNDIDQRQGWLALGKIVAQMLAGIGLLAGIIEYVVDQVVGLVSNDVLRSPE